MKVSNHGGRLNLNDFEPADRVLINKAWGFYRCLISTEDAFPSHIKEMEFVQRAWKDACASVEADIQPHPDVIKLVSVYRCAGISTYDSYRFCNEALRCGARSRAKYATLLFRTIAFVRVNQARVASTI
jgi:hypothetical protein